MFCMRSVSRLFHLRGSTCGKHSQAAAKEMKCLLVYLLNNLSDKPESSGHKLDHYEFELQYSWLGHILLPASVAHFTPVEVHFMLSLLECSRVRSWYLNYLKSFCCKCMKIKSFLFLIPQSFWFIPPNYFAFDSACVHWKQLWLCK